MSMPHNWKHESISTSAGDEYESYICVNCRALSYNDNPGPFELVLMIMSGDENHVINIARFSEFTGSNRLTEVQWNCEEAMVYNVIRE